MHRNRNGVALKIYIREYIPREILTKFWISKDIEALFIEVKFRKWKWLLCKLHHPTSRTDQYLENIDSISILQEKIILGGDFNSQRGENCVDTFICQHHLQSINNQHSRYKNPTNPTCIDLFLTNSPKSFYKTKIFLTGLWDSRKLVPSILKTTFTKLTAEEIMYHDFEKFNEQCFNNDLYTYLSSESIKICRSFENIFLKTLNKHASLKKC